MPRAFLSHSSRDKDLVRQVAGSLNAANIHFDELTFEQGSTSADEILNGLAKTDLFVFFASRSSLESNWVRAELKLASSRIMGGSIAKILTFIIDGTDAKDLPEWLRDFVYRKINNASFIADIIRSRLIEIDIEQTSFDDFFMGREEQLGSLKKALSKPSSTSPVCIQLSGWDGIGRRTLARKALRETYPWIGRIYPEVTLGDGEAEAGLFRALLRLREEMPLSEINHSITAFQSSESGNRISKLVAEISSFSDKKQILFIRSGYSFLQDNGDFQPWIAALLLGLKRRNFPVLVIVSQRMVPPSKRSKYQFVYFTHVTSLPEETSVDLFSQLLKRHQIEFDLDFLREMSPYVSGHPRNIQLAAEFTKEFGIGRVQLDKVAFRELLSERAATLLQKVSLTLNQKKLVAVFGDYPLMSIEDIIRVIDFPDEEFKNDILYLEEHGIIEWESRKYLRLAPYLIDTVSRTSWTKEVNVFRREVTTNLLDRVKSMETNDFVRIATIDAATLASLRTGDSGPAWLTALCLPSHYLHIAKEAYDDGKHQLAASLCQKALDRSTNLTSDAIVEALRLRAMSLARLGEDDLFQECLTALSSYYSKSARRNLHFVSGFRLRIKGLMDQAEREFRKAYTIDKRNFHVLRELAQTLVSQERFSEAEIYARAAYLIAPTNVFIIDNLISVLVGMRKTKEELLDDSELNELFQALEAVSYLRPGMYEIRRAEFEMKVGRKNEALKLANQAVGSAPKVFGQYVARAQIKLKAGLYSQIEDDVRKMEEIARDSSTGEGKSKKFMITVVIVRRLIELGDFLSAKEEIYKYQNIPHFIRESLVRDLALRIMSSGRAESALISWASAKLGG